MRSWTAKALLLVLALLVSAFAILLLGMLIGGFTLYVMIGMVVAVSALAGKEITPASCTACGGRRFLESGRGRTGCPMCGGLRNQSLATLTGVASTRAGSDPPLRAMR